MNEWMNELMNQKITTAQEDRDWKDKENLVANLNVFKVLHSL